MDRMSCKRPGFKRNNGTTATILGNVFNLTYRGLLKTIIEDADRIRRGKLIAQYTTRIEEDMNRETHEDLKKPNYDDEARRQGGRQT